MAHDEGKAGGRYGGGCGWFPKEDIFQMFCETKSARQSNGLYAGTFIARHNNITGKMQETVR